LVYDRPYVWSDDPLDTRSISLVKIRDPLDTRSQTHMFSDNSRLSRYKVSSEDTMILSIQNPGLMLLGATHWFMVDLMFGVMILSIQDLYLQ